MRDLETQAFFFLNAIRRTRSVSVDLWREWWTKTVGDQGSYSYFYYGSLLDELGPNPNSQPGLHHRVVVVRKWRSGQQCSKPL